MNDLKCENKYLSILAQFEQLSCVSMESQCKNFENRLSIVRKHHGR